MQYLEIQFGSKPYRSNLKQSEVYQIVQDLEGFKCHQTLADLSVVEQSGRKYQIETPYQSVPHHEVAY